MKIVHFEVFPKCPVVCCADFANVENSEHTSEVTVANDHECACFYPRNITRLNSSKGWKVDVSSTAQSCSQNLSIVHLSVSRKSTPFKTDIIHRGSDSAWASYSAVRPLCNLCGSCKVRARKSALVVKLWRRNII